MKKISTKKIIYFLVAIGLLVISVLYIILSKNYSQPAPVSPKTNKTTTTATTAVKKPGTATVPKKIISQPEVSKPAAQSYLEAVATYKSSGYYFQFVSCQALPGTLTLKAGKKFMLDNRDNTTRTIAVQGGQSFQIGPYGFAVATAPSTAGTHYITCDGGGSASISVQL